MINTIKTGIGICLFSIIGIGIGFGFEQTLNIEIGIEKILFQLIGFGIGKVDLSAIGTDINCQVLDFPIPIV